MKNAASIRVYCLGHFRVEKDGAPLDGASRAQRKPLDLLKTLIALGGENVPEQQITDALWPDSDGDAAKQNFRTTLHRLRALIGPDALPLTRGSLSLDARLVWSDVHELAGHLQRAEGFLDSADASGAGQPALQAAALYTGPFLDGEFEPPEILTTREKLHGRFLRVLSEAGRALEKAGQPGEAIRLYQKGMEADPIAEELAQALMRAQLKEGRPSEAAAVYQRLRRSLEAQGPIAPSAETEAVWGRLPRQRQGRRDGNLGQNWKNRLAWRC
jgi:DNA-binding SARP family transcriptional activator